MTVCMIRGRVFHLKIGLQEVIQSGWSGPRASVLPRECCCKCPEKRGLIATFALVDKDCGRACLALHHFKLQHFDRMACMQPARATFAESIVFPMPWCEDTCINS